MLRKDGAPARTASHTHEFSRAVLANRPGGAQGRPRRVRRWQRRRLRRQRSQVEVRGLGQDDEARAAAPAVHGGDAQPSFDPSWTAAPRTDAYPELVADLRELKRVGGILVAHNLAYDACTLLRELKRVGGPRVRRFGRRCTSRTWAKLIDHAWHGHILNTGAGLAPVALAPEAFQPVGKWNAE